MTRPASIAGLGSEFDDFLFASVGEDRNGMPLSVLSALARLDVDPWQEAAKLALLPGQTAIQRLASLIAALPDGASSHLDSGTIAARLIALLPREARIRMAPREVSLGAAAAGNSQALIFAILMIFMMGIQLIIASR